MKTAGVPPLLTWRSLLCPAKIRGLQVKPKTLAIAGSWFAVLFWAAAITFLSSLGQKDLEPIALPVPYWDKFLHFVAFSVGAGLLSAAFRISTDTKTRKVFWLAIAIISVFGMIDEWHQLYTPSRSGGDVGDWTADTIGAAFGAWMILKLWPISLQKFLNSGN